LGADFRREKQEKEFGLTLMFEVVHVMRFSHRIPVGLGVFRVDEGEYKLVFFLFFFFKKKE
jgi:hypothetical protein